MLLGDRETQSQSRVSAFSHQDQFYLFIEGLYYSPLNDTGSPEGFSQV